ncbi:MAG TPA: hypothetical protein VHL78_12060 [Actinomycetota bacterium]|nr:hypothetical protein [Actinomycetota bacterium]
MALFMEVHGGAVIGDVQTAQRTPEGHGIQAVALLRHSAERAREVLSLVRAPSREAMGASCREGGRAEHILELPSFVA